jgi:predicted alpha-1,2-mannosidase
LKGHVFPGATLPFGMAKAVADCNGDNQGGFASDGSDIVGFSHMHDSGTGGSPSLGLFPIFPQSGCPADDINNCKFAQTDRAIGRVNDSVVAYPGYFSLSLTSGITAEMTVTNHTALYRFTFPENPTFPYPGPNGTAPGSSISLEPVLLLELADLPMSRINGNINVDAGTGRMTGNGTFSPSFGIGSYTAFFCADWSGATIKDTGIFVDIRASNRAHYVQVQQDGVDNVTPAGGYVRFNAPTNNQILARVGMSFISSDQACSNAQKEISDFGFNKTVSAAQAAWRQKLNVVSIDTTGVNSSFAEIFWSGVYRGMISPQDYTGENPLWNSTEPYYDSFYCIWDSFRSIHQMITLLDPESQTRMIRALIDIYRHEGKLPDCRMSLSKGFTQGGSNADIVLADSYLKNITNGVDWATAYEGLVSDAEVEPLNWGVEGRGGLQSWHDLHYIPVDDFDSLGVGPHTRSISRTVEYAYDDFCIAQVAKGLGHMDDYQKYLGRSDYWRNLYKNYQESYLNGKNTGYVGFLQPKYLNGTWGYQDPAFCSPLLNFTSCYLNPDGHETYEGSAWLYTFFVPQNMASLIDTLGGADAFTKRLDFLHESGLLYIGDEQAFLAVYQYHHAGRPGKSAARAHYYIPSQFNTTVGGIAGNDDSGAMGSFVALSMLGIFPNPGQNVYYITPPFFPSVSIKSPATGKTATIKNINFDPSYKNIYIQSATLNGKKYTKNWLTHSFFLEGGTLELTLGSTESQWGTGSADVPPSYSPTGNTMNSMARDQMFQVV